MASLRQAIPAFVTFCPAVFLLHPFAALSQSPATQQVPAQRDGRHDFDFEDGTWKIHLKRLEHPLTGSHTWTEFDGTTTTRRLWNGSAHIEQFETDGVAGRVEGLTLRIYNPEAHQWSIYWANSKNGELGLPAMVGDFKDGRGEFYDQEPYHGRMIFVRFIWSNITHNSAHFEQSFSDDGGKNWEVNWITDQTRVSGATDLAEAGSAAR